MFYFQGFAVFYWTGLFNDNDYGDLWGLMGIYITPGLSINPHKSQPGLIKNQYS